MKIEFLVEDQSGGKLISEIMERYISETSVVIEYHILPYKGIGGLKKGPNATTVKSNHLLSELPKRLRALQYQNFGLTDVSVFVVLDNDDRNTDEFYMELEDVAVKNNIDIDHVFCIAVEEMEAWLLGDYEALQEAYPEIKDRIISKYSAYEQDSICGTWEMLADIITPKGIKYFKKNHPTSYDVGKKKYEWAEKIGAVMRIRDSDLVLMTPWIYNNI